jgi:hypothetical protein
VLGGHQAAKRPPGQKLLILAAAARGEETGLGDEQEDGPEDEGGDVYRLQRGVDQAAFVTSALP